MVRSRAALTQMKQDWQAWLKLESASLVARGLEDIRKEVYWMEHKPIRVMFMLFERWGFQPVAPAPRFFRGLTEGIPDERISEQVHASLRNAQRYCKNEVTSRINRQQNCIHSGVLEERGVPHEKITEAEFVGGMFLEPGGSTAAMLNSRNHKLPEEFSAMMGKNVE